MLIPIKPISSRLHQFAAKQLQGKYCLMPYVQVSVDFNGDVALCGCNLWHPSMVGNIMEQTLEQILTNDASIRIRSSIADGSYIYCDADKCGVINAQDLLDISKVPPPVVTLIQDAKRFKMPHEIKLALDRTCNLSCPSCRTEIVNMPESQIEAQKQIGARVSANMFPSASEDAIKIHISTTGELFASPLCLEFVNNIPVDRYPNVSLCIQTNGLLAPRRWHRLGLLQNSVSQITVTTDAATADTYELLRRGGQWTDICQSLQWISDKCREQNIEFRMRMIVQQANFQEMVLFYDQADALGAFRVEYGRLTDWGTYGLDFASHDVFDPAHHQYHEAQAFLRKVIDRPKTMAYGGLGIDI